MKLPSLMNPFWKELQNFLQKTKMEPADLCYRYDKQKAKKHSHQSHRSEAEGLI